MNTYVSTKIVRAEEMGEIDFLREKWERDNRVGTFCLDIPENLPGYKVLYPDGYVSWSPKGVFETTSRLITDDEMDLLMKEVDALAVEGEDDAKET